MRTILSFIAAATAVLALLTGCGRDATSPDAEVSVVATTPQVADFVREVGGERVAVTQVLPANADPHEYEPRPSDAEAIAGADLIVRSGGDVDGWLDQLVESSGSAAPVLTLIDAVKTQPGEGGDVDPHWWQDPGNAILAVAAIRAELASIDASGAAGYRRRAAAYSDRLGRLDREIARCVGSVPARERKLVTSHDSLGYYAARYGIEIIGATIPSLSTQAQSSAGETADLIDLIRRTGVKTIFPEAGVSAQLEESIASEAGASVGGELWADTLGPAGTPAATYVGAMESNTSELVAGFTGGARSCIFVG